MTTEGKWTFAPPFITVEQGSAETFYGEALTRVLEASRTGARDPGDHARRPLLELARSRTWFTFIRGTACCDVERDEVGFRFFPERFAHGKPLVPSKKPAIVLPADAVSIQLGASLRAAFLTIGPERRSSHGTKRKAGL